MKEVLDLLGNYAFPIVMCIVLFWQNDKLTNIIGDLTGTLAEIKTMLQSMDKALDHLEQKGE